MKILEGKHMADTEKKSRFYSYWRTVEIDAEGK
jgi:hypothetical protein